MIISGLQKTTLLDYPGHVASTIFFGGCNMRCPFCHNMNLVLGLNDDPTFSDEEVLNFLASRLGILDGVCITGGEPTLVPELPDFIRKIKNLGLSVKLDTNGTNPEVLKNLVYDKLIDYVAMDIKSSLDNYATVCAVPNIRLAPIRESIDFLINSQCVEYEFRTTVVSDYHTSNVMEEIGKLLQGAKRYYLQNFVDSEYVFDHSLTPCTKEKLQEYVRQLEKYISFVDIRGID